MIQIKSIKEPFTTPALAVKGATTLSRAHAMGLLPEPERGFDLDATTFQRLADGLRRAGIGAAILSFLANPDAVKDPAVVGKYLDRLYEVLEVSPVPASEWKRVLGIIGPDILSHLLSVSPASVRRYSSTVRSTPDDIASRLHCVALIVGDLASAYNDIGIRQWFARRRTQLDGRAPAELLVGEWSPDDSGPRRVRALALALTGSPAT